MPNKQNSLKTLTKGLAVLSFVERSDAPVTMTEVAESFDESPAIVFRILKTLAASGYIRQVEGSKRYVAIKERERLESARITIRIIRALSDRSSQLQRLDELAGRVNADPNLTGMLLMLLKEAGFTDEDEKGQWSLSPRMLSFLGVFPALDLISLAGPVMESLREQTEESVGLWVRTGAYQVAVNFKNSRQPIRYVLDIGTTYPITRGCAGKAALAWLGESEIRAILADPALASEDVFVGVLLEELRQIRQAGYAMSKGERVPGASAVATAIFDEASRPQGVINISFPSFRIGDEKMMEFGELLVAELKRAGLWLKDDAV